MSSESSFKLYRLPEEGKLGGVCAGLADYFGFAVWPVRFVFIGAMIFSGSLVFWAYLLAWFLLNQKSIQSSGSNSKLDQLMTESPRQALRYVSEQLQGVEQRVRHIEQHVTSDSYRLKREIDNLK